MPSKESSERTKEYIAEALFQLMKEKPYESINVSGITKKAGVGRATFYRYFKSKEDILRYFFDREMQEFNTQIRFVPRCKDDYYDFFAQIFKKFREKQNVLKVLIQAHMEYMYLDFLTETYRSFYKIPNPIMADLYSGALFNLSLNWVKDGCQTSIIDMIDNLYRVFFKNIAEKENHTVF